LPRIARVLRRDAIDETEHVQRAQGDVGGIADRRRNDVQRGGGVLLPLREIEEVGHEARDANERGKAVIVPRAAHDNGACKGSAARAKRRFLRRGQLFRAQ
jgi:hypothetical protein